jgi:hypothetical protein
MKLHLAGDTLIDPTAFERETLNKLNARNRNAS